jgi:hypothetical protein
LPFLDKFRVFNPENFKLNFTFDFLKTAKRYSILGADYLGLPAVDTYAGEPWEVMRANSFVYNINTDEVVAISSITQRVEVARSENYFVSSGLILPGALTDDGSRVKDYSAWYLFDRQIFRYSEVSHD